MSQYHSQIYLIASLRLVSVMTTFSSKLQNETSLNRKKKRGGGVDADTTSLIYEPELLISKKSSVANCLKKEKISN